MTRISFSQHGPEVSRLALGTWRLLADPAMASPEAVLGLLRAALDLGITSIDTAEIYGGYKVEAALGEALRRDPGVKGKIEIITKCGIYVPGPAAPERCVAHYDASAARIATSAETSLRLLGVEVLDVLLVHRPDWLAAHEETASALNRLTREGKIRAAGVSNYSAAQFAALSAFMDQPLVTNQVEFSLFHTAPIHDGVFDQAQERKFSPMAWSVLGGGRLFAEDNEAAARVRAAMAGMAARYDNATPEALAHAWVLAHPSRPVSILGTTKTERLRASARAAGLVLEREDWYALREAAQGRRIP